MLGNYLKVRGLKDCEFNFYGDGQVRKEKYDNLRIDWLVDLLYEYVVAH